MAMTDYDSYRDTYREELDRAVGFTGKRHDFFTRAKADELVRLAARHLGAPGDVESLDVGCGIGLTDGLLRGHFRSVTGVDVTPGVLERAAASNPGVRYELYDGHTLPFADGSFDLTFAVCVVQVVPPHRRSRLLAELSRVTRPRGLVVAVEHNPLNPLTRLVVRRCTFGSDATMVGARDLAALFRPAGLVVVDRGYLLLVPSERLRSLERRLARLPLGAQYYLAARRAGIAASS